jgi:hypothetical protein
MQGASLELRLKFKKSLDRVKWPREIIALEIGPPSRRPILCVMRGARTNGSDNGSPAAGLLKAASDARRS